MGFRRGSRSSREQKSSNDIVIEPQLSEVKISPQTSVVDGQWYERKRARDQQNDKIREDKERRREALRQSRKNARREAANEVKRKRYEQRHPKPAPKDPRVALGTGYRLLGTNINGDEVRQMLGADGSGEIIVKRRFTMIELSLAAFMRRTRKPRTREPSELDQPPTSADIKEAIELTFDECDDNATACDCGNE